MEVHNGIGLRESLEQLRPEVLRDMLQGELERQNPDPDSVRLMLDILENRKAEEAPKQTRQKEEAWQRYRQKVAGLKQKQGRHWNLLAKAASVAVIAGILFVAVPADAQAETFWEMLQRWSRSVVEYFDRDDVFVKSEFVFVTDNEGLQEVYDAVVELGVTEPMVPTWLPENHVLKDIGYKNSPMQKGVWAWFADGDNEIVYKIVVYEGEPAHQYYKDDTYYETYEQEGAVFNIARNHDRWTVVWTKENIECFLTLDCQEDTLRRMLESIYVMGDS